MNKRKISLIMVATLVASVFSACTDLVTKEVDSRVVVSSGGTTNSKASDLLQASYNDLSTFTDQAGIYSLYEHTSDELIPPTRGVDWSDNGVWRSLYTHTWDPSHSYILSSWNALNQNAYRSSLILDASDVTAQQKAEAKFLRAFNRWFVMDLWGQMPIRNTTDGPSVNPVVKTRSEAFDIIVQDLTEALPDLPNTGPGSGETATRAAANALLARLYLNKAVYKDEDGIGPYTFDAADMTKVVEYCDAVTAAGYDLSIDYFKNFAKGGAGETILVSQQGSPQNRVYMTLHYNQNPSGWNGFATLADFYGKFEADDHRIGAPSPAAVGKDFHGIKLGFLIGQQVKDNDDNLIDTRTTLPLQFTPEVPLSGAATYKGIRVIKYHPATYDKYILMRYADVYLMKAEAIMRGGTSTQTALQVVNALRSNRGASALATLDANAMLDERGRELYWEGLRRVDLIRFERFNDSWSEKGDNKDDFRVLYCIPQQALDSNPNLKQNPGY
ncbi:MAG TPA: RagB/SusD family nutrient uptake outer membrane protein [Cyclobacteriaceae bacterium]|nr:RagB/SusD family nutrient uptake outer membrane protein [Cyclobacteriaceae bacterium]